MDIYLYKSHSVNCRGNDTDLACDVVRLVEELRKLHRLSEKQVAEIEKSGWLTTAERHIYNLNTGLSTLRLGAFYYTIDEANGEYVWSTINTVHEYVLSFMSRGSTLIERLRVKWFGVYKFERGYNEQLDETVGVQKMIGGFVRSLVELSEQLDEAGMTKGKDTAYKLAARLSTILVLVDTGSCEIVYPNDVRRKATIKEMLRWIIFRDAPHEFVTVVPQPGDKLQYPKI